MARTKRPRSPQGWAIPAKNTLSYHIYLGLAKGETSSAIAKRLSESYAKIAVLAWGIRNPDAKNLRQQAFYRFGHEKRLMQMETKP